MNSTGDIVHGNWFTTGNICVIISRTNGYGVWVLWNDGMMTNISIGVAPTWDLVIPWE